MAYDARWEDYQRLSLRFARSLDGSDPATALKAFATFGRRFAQNRDSLPQSDEDRAFHLVADATVLIDYNLPFAESDERAEDIIRRAAALLDEAISLDAHCHDALRMQSAARNPSFESYYDFLRDGADEVRARCEEARELVGGSDDTPDDRIRLARSIAMHPYYRWVATMADKALVCGRNREAIRLSEQLLALDPDDGSDVRFTCALAYAKLEDEEGLDALARRCRENGVYRGSDDAWLLLARASLAHKRRDLASARERIADVIRTYPHAAATLVRQRELPDGVFARIAVQPFSEDELIVAASEGTVLLQEGRDRRGRGAFGSWVVDAAAELAPAEERAEVEEALRDPGPGAR